MIHRSTDKASYLPSVVAIAPIGRKSVTLLQVLMRERRLTREETIDVLDQRARTMGINDFTLSLRQLDRWLSQEVGDPRSVRCRVAEAEFGYSIERLLSVVPRQAMHVDLTSSVTSPMEHFGAIVGHLAGIDHDVGGGSALGPAVEVGRSVIGAASQLTGKDRNDCLHLAARCSELIGWLHQDFGSLPDAREWTVRALELAEAGDAPSLLSYMLMRRSAVAVELDLADEAVLFAQGALQKAAGGEERALALRSLAFAHALKGDEPALRWAVDAATDNVEVSMGPAELAPYCTTSFIQSEAGAAALTLGKPGLAVQYLEPAAASWPTTQRRDRAICLARLSLAHARRGEMDLAESTVRTAADIAVGCASRRFGATLQETIQAIRHRGGGERAELLAEEVGSLL